MIPAKFLSKIGIHELEIEGVKVKASHVTDNIAVTDHKINQLRASLNKQRPVVGVDVKVSVPNQKQQISRKTTSELLILYGGNCCLVIKLANLDGNFPTSITNLLADKNTCFVGFKIYREVTNTILNNPNCYLYPCLSNVVEVGQLAARVLKNPNLSKCGLEELDKEVIRKGAVATTSPETYCPPDSKASVAATGTVGAAGASPNWKSMVLSDE
ncbi:hypothetical protein ACOSQ2_009072 [Xanthoceras sorbifolium]